MKLKIKGPFSLFYVREKETKGVCVCVGGRFRTVFEVSKHLVTCVCKILVYDNPLLPFPSLYACPLKPVCCFLVYFFGLIEEKILDTPWLNESVSLNGCLS